MNREIKTYNFSPLPVEIEVKDLSFVKSVPHILGQPHKAKFYQLIWVKEGVFKGRIDFKDVAIHANEVLFISPGQVCEFDVSQAYLGKLVLFTASFFTRTEEDANFLYTAEILNPINSNHIVLIEPCLLSPLFTLLEEELKRANTHFQVAIAQNYLRIVLLETERHVQPAYVLGIKNTARIFYHALEKHFKINKNTSYYADLIGVSEKILTKELKSLTGNTPKVCIDARVILEAKRLLSFSNLSMKEIGFELGFEEPTNFTKYFRKHTNLTPNAFRDSMQHK
ncbi:helix-turn-helix domain-containing protein [Myroides odoratus]|uniref:AraC family transcriptional regulator n=1 Tax=Myroides odoratus TaxID=256 RepID=UPI0039B0A5D9